MRKKIWTLFTLSAIALLLLASPLLLFNVFLQPVQAQSNTNVFFQTDRGNPASGSVDCSNTDAYLAFEASGTFTDDRDLSMTGTFQVTNGTGSDAQVLYSGEVTSPSIQSGYYVYYPDDKRISIALPFTLDRVPSSGTICASTNNILMLTTDCVSDGQSYPMAVNNLQDGPFGIFSGDVQCSYPTPPSSSMSGTTTTQDRDSDDDGIPDSSDKCTHNSNHRCFKDEGTSTRTTTHEQQQPSSSNGTGNQTR